MIDIEKEYYLAFEQTRDGDRIHFSEHGGVDIEENWESVKSIVIPYHTSNSSIALTLNSLFQEERGQTSEIQSHLLPKGEEL